MTVHLVVDHDAILIQVSAEDGGLLGDFTAEIYPGQVVLGKSFEEWAALGDGQHTIGGDNGQIH